MKTFYLKKIRKIIYDRYEVRKSDAGNAGDKPWCIYTGPKTCLAYHKYATKEDAITAMKQFWWEEADKLLWEHKDKKKSNKYPW